MRVRVVGGVGDLARDLAAAPPKFIRSASSTVRRNAVEGNKIAQRLSRQKAGPHGKNFYKRMTSEMTGPLTAEYGPEGSPKTEFVGVGFRSGENLDLPNSADLIGPKVADELGDAAEGSLR